MAGPDCSESASFHSDFLTVLEAADSAGGDLCSFVDAAENLNLPAVVVAGADGHDSHSSVLNDVHAAVAGFVGAGKASEADHFTQTMSEITIGENPEWTIPAMDYTGVPSGIDIRLVVETGLTPTINTGIAHKKPGVGQVGAGVVRAPMKCFEKALIALAESVGVS